MQHFTSVIAFCFTLYDLHIKEEKVEVWRCYEIQYRCFKKNLNFILNEI